MQETECKKEEEMGPLDWMIVIIVIVVIGGIFFSCGYWQGAKKDRQELHELGIITGIEYGIKNPEEAIKYYTRYALINFLESSKLEKFKYELAAKATKDLLPETRRCLLQQREFQAGILKGVRCTLPTPDEARRRHKEYKKTSNPEAKEKKRKELIRFAESLPPEFDFPT